MARLIVKSPYFKGGSAKPAGGYLRYIATRERVEILPDDRPPTKRQTQLIEKLTKDFPDTKTLLEYGDYQAHPTKFNASQFLTLAMEENWSKVQELDGYAKYIATRPRAERMGEHGLFGDEDAVDLNAAMAEVNSCTGNIWTHIISLRREDAERLGFDHADAWRALLRAHRNDIAEAMHIPPEDFRWYAAFHDEGGHPHVHMMAWSKKPGQAYLNRDGIRKIMNLKGIAAKLYTDGPKTVLHIYEDKSQSRDELVQETRSAMLALAQKMQNSACEHPEAEQMIWELALELGSVKGKKSYGYLPKDLKRKVDGIVDQMELLPSVDECYGRWWKLQCRLNDFYAEKERQRPPLSQQKEFRQIKNALLQVAEQVRQNKITFEDAGAEQDAEQNATYGIPYPVSAWYGMATDESMSLEERDEAAKQLEALADGGDRYAQYLTGILYRDGGLLIPDTEKAQHYLELAARQDHVAAQYALGKLLLSDDPEVQNPAQGFYWLERAAQNGSDYAAYRLGKEYLSGKSAPKNPERAAEYVRMAAECGNPYAQYLLGRLYLGGDGVPQDKDAAYDWFQKAQAQGHDYAGFFMCALRAVEAGMDFSWIASSGRSRRTFCSRQRGCYTTWERFFSKARPPRKTAASRSTANASPSCAGCVWLPDTRRTITSRSRRIIPCRWAGSTIQTLHRHRQRKPK